MKKRVGVLKKMTIMNKIRKALLMPPIDCFEVVIFAIKRRKVMIDIVNAGIMY